MKFYCTWLLVVNVMICCVCAVVPHQMSKSRGNVVEPHDLISRFGVDPVRYFLLKEGSLQQDGGQLPPTLSPTLHPSLLPFLLPSLHPSHPFSLPPFLLPSLHSSLPPSLLPSFLPFLPVPHLPLPPLQTMYIYTDFSEDRLVAMTNADLPHTVGNLLQRVSTPRLNPGGPRLKFSLNMFPIGGQSTNCRASAEDYKLITNLQNLPGKQTCLLLFTCLQMCFLICVDVVKVHYDAFEFGKGLSAIMKCLTQVSFIKLTVRKKNRSFLFSD